MPRIQITAKLWVKDERFADFEAFENAALAIIGKHDGKVLSVQKDHAATGGPPHETHVLDFPSISAFEAYQVDPDLLGMKNLRASCIEKTVVVVDDLS